MQSNNKISILIADDHPLFRMGVRQELESCPDFELVGETGNGKEALNLIIKLNPDVAILDFQMPGLNGLEILNKLREKKVGTQVILLTMHSEEKIFLKALNEGVRGYVLKDDAVLDIIEAVKNVTTGKTFISNSLSEILVQKLTNYKMNDKKENLINSLTASEKKILSLVAELKSNNEIAEELFLSRRTIENHKVIISHKLQLASSKDLLKFALQSKDKFI
jgi:two-component system, NarL family, response regulator DegU